MTLPNAITIVRISLIPVFVYLAYLHTDPGDVASFVVFVVASASDMVDGYLARRYDTISRVGKFLDPLADKLLVVAALVVLVDVHDFPLIAAVVLIVRELAVQILRIRIVSTGGDLPASPAAKAKTFAQLAMVGWWLLPWDDENVAHWALLALAVTTTLWSGGEYFIRAFRPASKEGAR